MDRIINVTTKEELAALYNCSAMTWEGLSKNDWKLALDTCGTDDAKGYVTSGKVMNDICHLTGNNAYPDDLHIFSIDNFRGLAMSYGARWMDDIIDNNADREDYHPFRK